MTVFELDWPVKAIDREGGYHHTRQLVESILKPG